MLARVTHLLPLTTIRRQRTLPINGRILVRSGQKVTATDIIADARLGKDHLLLDISRGLGLPSSQVDKYIVRKEGDEVASGDIIAGPVGVLQRTVRSPKDGRLVAVGGGQVLLEQEGAILELRAGLSGTVIDLIPDRGAIIETQGALIQGVWGNNRIEAGVLTVLARSPEDELTVEHLDVSQRGAIILGGLCTQAEVLRMAAEIPLRALILASLTPNLISMAAKTPVPILVLEGFGRLPLNSITFEILSTNDKRDICLNTAPWNRINGTRPELVLPLPTSGQIPAPLDSNAFVAGQPVKVIRAPNTGQIATLVSLCSGLTLFPSGIRAPAAIICLKSGDQVPAPLANLELIA